MGIYEFMVAIVAIILGCSIPLTVLIGNQRNRAKQLQLAILQQEHKIEQLKLSVYEKETEKLRLEVASQQLVIENSKHPSN